MSDRQPNRQTATRASEFCGGSHVVVFTGWVSGSSFPAIGRLFRKIDETPTKFGKIRKPVRHRDMGRIENF